MTPSSTLIPTIIIYTAPTTTPDGLTVTSTSPTSISIMWETVPCAGRNAEITQYTVFYNPTSDPSDRISGSVMDTSNRVFTASKLIPRTEYTIEVYPDHIDFTDRIFLTGVSPATITMTTGVPQGSVFMLTSSRAPINDANTFLFRCWFLPEWCGVL